MRILLFVLIMFALGCNSKTPFGKSLEGPDEPVIIDLPKPETDSTISEKSPLNFDVFLNGNSITIKFNNKVFENVSIEALDTFIKKNNIAKISPRFSIRADSTTSYDQVKKVIEVFQNDSVNRFNLVTNVEK